MKTKLILLIAIGFCFASCDPAQKIEIENKTSSYATIKFFFLDNDYHKFSSFLRKDSLVLKLATNEKKIFNFGIGTWEMNNSLDSLVSKISKIEVVTEKSTELFSSKAQIKSFFSDRIVNDRYKARIKIQIE